MTDRNPLFNTQQYLTWLKQSTTQRLFCDERQILQRYARTIRGDQWLYVGLDASPRWLRETRAKHCIHAALSWQPSGNLYIDEQHWPFADNSLDVVVLQHTMDISSVPQQLIREATRCTAPNGYILITGWNPYGWCSGMRHLGLFERAWPIGGHAISLSRLQDWLLLLDFQVQARQQYAYQWPFYGNKALLKRIENWLQQQQWPLANAYSVLAQKNMPGLIRLSSRSWRPIAADYPLAVASKRPI